MEAVANQYRIFEETQPLRDELSKISDLLSSKEQEIEVIKKDLVLYQEKIGELEEKLG